MTHVTTLLMQLSAFRAADMPNAVAIEREVSPRHCMQHGPAHFYIRQATGLALPGADLDIVVLGSYQNLDTPGSGYSSEARTIIGDLLEVG